jgi:hypothetical protein
MAGVGLVGLYIGFFLLSDMGRMDRAWNRAIGLVSQVGGLAAIVSALYLLRPGRSKRIRIVLAVLFALVIPGLIWGMLLIRGF